MKKAALVVATLFTAPAFAQLPSLPIALPTLPALPALPIALPAAPAAGGEVSVVANGTGVVVTLDSNQTPPVSVTPVGLPPLPGL